MPSSYDHDGFTFDFDDSGDGHPVVLLHGFPQSRRSWDRLIPTLVDAGFRVLAPDQRGYSPGARPRQRRAYTVDLLVGDVIALADAVGLDRFHVVGHDWGGAVAWALGADHGDRVATVTSLSTPHPTAMLSAMTRSNQALRSWYMALFQLPWLPEWMATNRLATERFTAKLTASGLPTEEAAANVRLLRDGAARGAFNWYRALPFDPPGGVGVVDVPTLYVYGDADFALGPKAAELTQHYVTGDYRFERLLGADHWLPETAADEVATMLLRHLRDHPI